MSRATHGTRRMAAVVVASAVVASAAVVTIAEERTTAAGGRWVAGDLHIHTTYSHDSYGGPGDDNTGPDEAYTLGHSVESQLRIAASRGLAYLAITDHDDIRSQSDPAWANAGELGVTPISGYESSLRGHAQFLGAADCYKDTGAYPGPNCSDHGDRSAAGVTATGDALRADGGLLQVNHPANGSTSFPDDTDWGYLYEVVPDTVEVWNISRLWQPPFPSGSSNDDAVRYWEGWLDRGHKVGATGGSDNHWQSTTAVQGAGQPTTWVYVKETGERGVLEGLRAGRTFISHQPPAYGGPQVFLEGDGDGDGTFEAMVGDAVPPGATLRVVVNGAPGSLLRVVTDGGTQAFELVSVTSDAFEHRFTLPTTSTWLRAEIVEPDGQSERTGSCDPIIGSDSTYCRNMLAVLGMTSALYLEEREPEPEPTRSPGSGDEDVYSSGTTYARVSDERIVLGNELVERRWQPDGLATTALIDKRGDGREWVGTGPDFTLDLGATDLDSSAFDVTEVTVEAIQGGRGAGLRVRFELSGPGIDATRVAEVYEDVAGFRTRTVLEPLVALALFGYTLDEAAVGSEVAPTIHAFRGGADWRNPVEGWAPDVSIGDPHTGTWRDTRSAGPGEALAGAAQWISVADGDRSAFLVMERNDHPSSRAAYSSGTARIEVDLSRDVAGLGPFEEDIHVENPTDGPSRHRLVKPGQSLALEPAFIGLGSHDGDEPWQFHNYLVGHRMLPYELDVTFNSNGTDGNVISTGAKDDMNYDTVVAVADKARALGIDTFILDDGWQAISGDWFPDCPDHPEPRHEGDPVKFAPRFPDCDFSAVREAIAPMKLGLWMSPMHFHNESATYEAHPEWACAPVGHGLGAVNALQPESGSNEAGIGMWGPDVIPHIEARIRDAIESWGVTYFKFDFLVWVDCAGQSDLYEYREAFMAMVDRLQLDHPQVTYQIDETNDYRLFPFESVTRGPSWFQNGSPETRHLLHNIWNLSPYVPAFSLGQHFLGRRDDPSPVDTRMAAALPSHLTFFSDLRHIPDTEIETARPWIDFYKANTESFTHVLYPVLADPVANSWTALQSWDPERGEGAALVFRQEAGSDSVIVPLVNVPPGREFDVFLVPTGEHAGRYSSAQLSAGYEVTLANPRDAHVVVIRPAGGDPR